MLDDYIAKRVGFLATLEVKLKDRDMTSRRTNDDDAGKIEVVGGGSYYKNTQIGTPANEIDDFDILVVLDWAR